MKKLETEPSIKAWMEEPVSPGGGGVCSANGTVLPLVLRIIVL